jgi:hypothetical protein
VSAFGSVHPRSSDRVYQSVGPQGGPGGQRRRA